MYWFLWSKETNDNMQGVLCIYLLKVCAMYKEIKVHRFHINRLNQKLFLVIINTGKTFKGGWEVSTVFWQCFASINITEKKFLVQSLYVKWRSLISLYIAHTLAGLSERRRRGEGIALKDFGRSFNPISIRWADYAHHITTRPRIFISS